jgi:hypothetical protein
LGWRIWRLVGLAVIERGLGLCTALLAGNFKMGGNVVFDVMVEAVAVVVVVVLFLFPQAIGRLTSLI